MKAIPSFKRLTDVQLMSELARLAQHERHATTALIVCLEEFDRRRLYLGLGFPSLYAYCKARLNLSEDAAYKRVEVARASRRCPRLLDMLNDGRLSLTTACLLGKVASAESLESLLVRAAFKSKREVEVLIAIAHPQPQVPSVVRRLPEPKPVVVVSPAAVDGRHTEPSTTGSERAGGAAAVVVPASRRPVVAPLSATHYKLQVTISAVARDRLGHIQDLMRHRIPSGDPAAIIEHALEVLHADLLKRKAAEVPRPRERRGTSELKGRQIPASVRRAVFRRDGGACAFVSADGERCRSTSGVEFHHVRPYAVGGGATVENIEMRCRAHNAFEWTRHLDQETAALEPS